ncbi:MAG: HTTM domain-containing protein, partial [Myxococcales bacterium]|nr:HTTM domain-containing protein [Myxococcales bacterium]
STYLNHYYLLSLLLLLAAVMPLGDALSVDAWRRPERRRESFPAWCTWLLRAQVAVVYFYAGLAKLNAEWLIHGQPLNLWLGTMTELPHPWLQRFEVALAMSWAGFLYDTTIWLWLAWPRTRPYAFAVVAFFHLTVGLLFNIGMFPFIMVSAATVFFAPDWPRRALRRLRARGSQAGDSPPRARPMVGRWTKVGLALGAAFLLLQVLVPLRHLLYPGDVLWNELGMRWSWKVLVREKNGSVTFHLRLPDGKRQIVTPRKYLTDFQEREMSSQPDLILQLAHHIADDYAARGLGPVEVRAEARVSFNGRRSVLLLDPDVDLAQIEDGLGPAPWIRPAPGGPPVRLHPVAAR